MRRGLHALAGALLAAALAVAGCGGGGLSFVGIGSGGTGISGEGVGSGGTGMTASVGSVDGFASIIVNGTRFDIANARIVVADSMSLRLGMTVHVFGDLQEDLATGTATLVQSAADLRGTVGAVDPAAGTFSVLSIVALADETTVYAGGLGSLADLRAGDAVQVHGLPGTGGEFHATRVERLPAPDTPVLSGAVQGLDADNRTFSIGGLQVHYGAVDPALLADLAEGQLVRVRARDDTRPLQAVTVEAWHPVQLVEGEPLALGGLVTRHLGPSALQVDGVPVDASSARISGGPLSALQPGVRVEVAGTVRAGVLVASRIKLRARSAAPAAEPVYSARGTIGAFRSAASFRIQGQEIDASDAVFANGTAADLRNGLKAQVTGSRVADDVLKAERVEFLP